MDTTSLLTQNSTQQAQSAYAAGMSARALAAQQTAGGTPNMQKVKAAAQQFEGFFVGQMMEYMMAGVKPDAEFGGGQAEETWRSMLNQEYGKEIAKSGKLGIADKVMKSMLEAQARHSAAAAPAAAPAPEQSAGVTQTDAVLPQAAAATAAATAGNTAKATKLNISA